MKTGFISSSSRSPSPSHSWSSSSNSKSKWTLEKTIKFKVIFHDKELESACLARASAAARQLHYNLATITIYGGLHEQKTSQLSSSTPAVELSGALFQPRYSSLAPIVVRPLGERRTEAASCDYSVCGAWKKYIRRDGMGWGMHRKLIVIKISCKN